MKKTKNKTVSSGWLCLLRILCMYGCCLNGDDRWLANISMCVFVSVYMREFVCYFAIRETACEFTQCEIQMWRYCLYINVCVCACVVILCAKEHIIPCFQCDFVVFAASSLVYIFFYFFFIFLLFSTSRRCAATRKTRQFISQTYKCIYKIE